MSEALGIRNFLHRHLPAVMLIEGASGPNAWTRTQFHEWLREPGAIGRIAHREGPAHEVVGFFCGLRRRRELYLANLAVAPEARRQGVGTLLLRALHEVARTQSVERVVLEVRESNLPAQLLYKRAGYRAVEILRGHYGAEDGYRMSRRVVSTVAR